MPTRSSDRLLDGHWRMRGGLDLITPRIRRSRVPGGLTLAINYEPRDEGYRRIDGYERFDGRTPPSSLPRPEESDSESIKTEKQTVIDNARNAIDDVPGEGEMLGVWRLHTELQTGFTATGLTNGVGYRLRVRGVNAEGLGAQSLDSDIVTPIPNPLFVYQNDITVDTAGTAYEVVLDEAMGGTPPYTYTLAVLGRSGSLGTELSFDETTRTLTVNADNVGDLDLRYGVTDSESQTARYDFNVTYNTYDEDDLEPRDDAVYILAANSPDLPTGGQEDVDFVPTNWTRDLESLRSSVTKEMAVFKATRQLFYTVDDAEQTLTLPASAYFPGTTSITVEPTTAGRPQITSQGLLPSTGDRFFGRIRLWNDGRLEMAMGEDRTEDLALDTGFDLSDDFETRGRVKIEIGSPAIDTITVEMDSGDTTEPYLFSPDNSADVIQFFRRRRDDIPQRQLSKITFSLDEEEFLYASPWNNIELAIPFNIEGPDERRPAMVPGMVPGLVPGPPVEGPDEPGDLVPGPPGEPGPPREGPDRLVLVEGPPVNPLEPGPKVPGPKLPKFVPGPQVPGPPVIGQPREGAPVVVKSTPTFYYDILLYLVVRGPGGAHEWRLDEIQREVFAATDADISMNYRTSLPPSAAPYRLGDRLGIVRKTSRAGPPDVLKEEGPPEPGTPSPGTPVPGTPVLTFVPGPLVPGPLVPGPPVEGPDRLELQEGPDEPGPPTTGTPVPGAPKEGPDQPGPPVPGLVPGQVPGPWEEGPDLPGTL